MVEINVQGRRFLVEKDFSKNQFLIYQADGQGVSRSTLEVRRDGMGLPVGAVVTSGRAMLPAGDLLRAARRATWGMR